MPMTDRKLTFLRRFASTVVLWSLALWTILSGNETGFVLLISGLGLVGLLEYYLMLDAKKLPNPTSMKSSPTAAITGPPTRRTVRMLECWGDCNLFSFIPSLH